MCDDADVVAFNQPVQKGQIQRVAKKLTPNMEPEKRLLDSVIYEKEIFEVSRCRLQNFGKSRFR